MAGGPGEEVLEDKEMAMVHAHPRVTIFKPSDMFIERGCKYIYVYSNTGHAEVEKKSFPSIQNGTIT